MEKMSASKKSFSCQHCGRTFRRREHVQRHERIHTRETPFKCYCGRAFARGDLLRRHEKIAHNPDSANLDDPVNSSERSSPHQTQNSQSNYDAIFLNEGTRDEHFNDSQQIFTTPSDFSPTQRRSGMQLTTTSTPLPASGNDQFQTNMTNLPDIGNGSSPLNVLGDATTPLGLLSVNNQYSQFDEYDAFLDNADLSFLLPQMLEDETDFHAPQLHVEPENRNSSDASPSNNAQTRQDSAGQVRIADNDLTANCQVPSKRFPGHPYSQLNQPCWKISSSAYRRILQKLKRFSDVLPRDFVLLSRHTMSRFIEGCVKGFCEHFPFLHIATFSTENASPELILSMAAIGAQFRFESNRKLMLFDAAKVVIMEQLGHQVTSSVHHGSRHTDEISDHCRIQTLQALLCLLAVGLWGPEVLLQQGIALQSLVVRLLRNNVVSGSTDLSQSLEDENHWVSWIRAETRKRTIFVAYSLLTLMSLAYHIPPPFLTSEISSTLPCYHRMWNAKSFQDWDKCRRLDSSEPTFQTSLESLFYHSRDSNIPTTLPLFGNYVLIIGILQYIFLRRETLLSSYRHSISSKDVEEISRALQYWQAGWEKSREIDNDQQTANSPVIFNSTALLRLAWLRLHADLGPCRNLSSRDSGLIATAFNDCPPIPRGSSVMQPVLQAVHALSVPVRMGISFVARTQTISWSVQLSLSNLECSMFLCKWLEQLALTCKTKPLEPQEQKLVSVIYGLLRETGMFEDGVIQNVADIQDQNHKLRNLATGVAKLWAEVFKGMHVFELVDTIGASLAIYAELMERACSPESSD